ncbi:MAG: chromosomal replication initiator protein DnaA [Pseudomonadota bacterium]
MESVASEEGADTDQLWCASKAVLRHRLGEHDFESWIEPLEFVARRDKTVVLSAQSTYAADWVREYHSRSLLSVWRGHWPEIEQVQIEVGGRRAAAVAASTSSRPYAFEAQRPSQGRAVASLGTVVGSSVMPKAAGNLHSLKLCKDYLFDTFIESPSNELAFAAAREVAAADRVASLSPLIFYGGSGFGKTHLMHAICWQAKRQFPSKRIVCMQAEPFMQAFVEAIRSKGMQEFKRMVREVDIFALDDIQFLAGKTSTLEEFLHTINSLMDHEKQIILTADKRPNDLDGIEAFLKSRLASGLSVEVKPADYALRLAILRQRAAISARAEGVVVPDEVLDFMARIENMSGRELNGLMSNVITQRKLVNKAITIDLVRATLGSSVSLKQRRVTIDQIQKAVCRHFDVSLEDILSERRFRKIVRPRQIAMFLAKELTTRSLPDIGRRFGGRDHTTVIYSVRKIAELLGKDEGLRDDVDRIRADLTSR